MFMKMETSQIFYYDLCYCSIVLSLLYMSYFFVYRLCYFFYIRVLVSLRPLVCIDIVESLLSYEKLKYV